MCLLPQLKNNMKKHMSLSLGEPEVTFTYLSNVDETLIILTD